MPRARGGGEESYFRVRLMTLSGLGFWPQLGVYELHRGLPGCHCHCPALSAFRVLYMKLFGVSMATAGGSTDRSS